MAIVELSAQALSSVIHSGQASCREVMQAYLQRIADVNPRYNAIVRGVKDWTQILSNLGLGVAAFRSMGY